MKTDESIHKEIRSSLDRRLSSIVEQPGSQQRMLRLIHGEEKKVKRKISIGLVFAIIATIAVMGVAIAATINLFEQFGQTDQRFAQIAPQTNIDVDDPVLVEDTKTGTVTASITNAYYDGESLLLGYSIQGNAACENFTPTAEQMTQMHTMDQEIVWSNEEVTFATELETAKQNGSPWGMVKYDVVAADHTYVDETIDLGPWEETESHTEQGCFSAIRDYSNLPESARMRDNLSVSIAVYRNATYYYFDGQMLYSMSERTVLSPMTATVSRANSESVTFMGFEMLKGVQIGVTIQTSEVHLSAKVFAVDAAFPNIPDGSWFDLQLVDETGYEFSSSSFEMQDDRTMLFTFDGNGRTPITLNAYLLVVNSSGEIESTQIPVDING